MSISKNLGQQLASDNKNDPQQKQKITEMLGFMSVLAYEGIKEDIRSFLKEGYQKELDGYVLALSRMMKHKDAWDCIYNAFKETSNHLPNRYYKLFGMS